MTWVDLDASLNSCTLSSVPLIIRGKKKKTGQSLAIQINYSGIHSAHFEWDSGRVWDRELKMITSLLTKGRT